MTGGQVRRARREDYHKLVRVHAHWLDDFVQRHPAEGRWCPAQFPVSGIHDHKVLLEACAGREGRWGVVLEREQLVAFALCRADPDSGDVIIEQQTPRVVPDERAQEAAGRVVQFVLECAKQQGACRVHVHVHGFPDDAELLTAVYRDYGFSGELRYELLVRQLDPDQAYFSGSSPEK